jgi:hypothetical protein
MSTGSVTRQDSAMSSTATRAHVSTIAAGRSISHQRTPQRLPRLAALLAQLMTQEQEPQ